MSENNRNVRGMRDLLNKDSIKKQIIESAAREVALRYGFEEINTPVVEYSSVFNKTLGESSDIVTKEMYNFDDEKGRSLTLRPEATAGIARAIHSNGLLGLGEYRIPLKLFLMGPMFRYERPQKGRYRQFYQLNFEFFCDPYPESDVEIISLAYNFLKKIECPINLKINSLGDNKSRDNYKKELIPYLNKYKKELSTDSQNRLEKNPLRILDTKNNNDLEILSKAPKMIDFLSNESKKYYNETKSILKNLGIKYEEDTNLVRGLDYYKETVFEFKTDKLGIQQDTILGGGRYSFEKETINGVGWAAGIDRLIEIISYTKNNYPLASIVFNEELKNEAIVLVNKLRNSNELNGYIEIIYKGNIEKKIKKASKLNSKFIIFVDEKQKVKISNKLNNKKPIIDIKNIDEIIKVLNVN